MLTQLCVRAISIGLNARRPHARESQLTKLRPDPRIPGLVTISSAWRDAIGFRVLEIEMTKQANIPEQVPKLMSYPRETGGPWSTPEELRNTVALKVRENRRLGRCDVGLDWIFIFGIGSELSVKISPFAGFYLAFLFFSPSLPCIYRSLSSTVVTFSLYCHAWDRHKLHI